MSKTEGFLILDGQNAATTVDAAKKAAMLHSQNVVRRKLGDISNLAQNQRLLIQEKSQCIETTAKDYIEQLQKENMALVKMLAQRNKIIEQSGIELDRLRLHLLKMQEQNQQLALSNNQMLAELNSGKDRLKLLQHELGCKSGLLKAIKLELEGGRTKPCKNAVAQLMKSQEEGKSFKEGMDDEKPRKTKRNLEPNGLGPSEQDQYKDKTQNKRPFSRRQSGRFKATEAEPAEDLFETNNSTEVSSLPDGKEETENKSEGHFMRRQSARFKAVEVKNTEDMFEANRIEVSASQLPDNKEQIETKRPFVRRQSARFKAAEVVKPAGDSMETNGTKICESKLPDDTAGEQGSTSECAIEKNEGHTVSSALKYEPQEFGRSSLSRPSRVAAKKVQSYKEIPLNVKMRRCG